MPNQRVGRTGFRVANNTTGEEGASHSDSIWGNRYREAGQEA